MNKGINFRISLAWVMSLPATFFAVGFLGNYYPDFLEVGLLALIAGIVAGLLFYRLLGKAVILWLTQRMAFVVALLLFLTLTAFVVAMFGMADRFPSLFDPRYFLLENGQLPPFVIGSVLALPVLMWLRYFVAQKELIRTGLYPWMDEKTPGVFISGFFFCVYLLFASIFNQPSFDVDDIFFDSDGLLWRTRFTTMHYQDYYWRAVHPFVLILMRPLVTLVSIFLKGDKLAAAFVLVAFAGAFCVFLAWYFINQTVGNSIYAVLIASLLGASAAHLVFASLIETYIFLVAVMMIFLILLLNEKSLGLLVIAGLVSFGITITNFIQTVIAFIFVSRNFKLWLIYGAIVGALIVPLSLLNNYIYPGSQPYFFIPSSYTAEAGNTFLPSVNRAKAVGRVMFFQSIVAPDPLILKEEIPFLKVWIFKASPMRLSEYRTGFGKAVGYFWLALLVLGGTLFTRNLFKGDHRFTGAFLAILMFNFGLHMRYGKDIFLYSTNWTYAIILFLALAWKELAGNKWFHGVLLLFLVLLLVNNSRLLFTMLSTAALHIK
jgi:hypothetical protein